MSKEGNRDTVLDNIKVRTKLKPDASWMQPRDTTRPTTSEEEKPWLAEVRARRLNGAPTSPISSPVSSTPPPLTADTEIKAPTEGYLIRGVFTKVEKPASPPPPNGISTTRHFSKKPSETYKLIAPHTVRSTSRPEDSLLSPEELEKRREAASSVLKSSSVRKRSYVLSAAKKYEAKEASPDPSPDGNSPSFVAKKVEVIGDEGTAAPAPASSASPSPLSAKTSASPEPKPRTTSSPVGKTTADPVVNEPVIPKVEETKQETPKTDLLGNWKPDSKNVVTAVLVDVASSDPQSDDSGSSDTPLIGALPTLKAAASPAPTSAEPGSAAPASGARETPVPHPRLPQLPTSASTAPVKSAVTPTGSKPAVSELAVETKSATVAEPEPKPEPQPEPKPKPEPKVEPQPQPVVPKPKPEPKVEPQPEAVVPKPKPGPKVEPQPEPVVPKPKPESKVEPQPQPVVPKPKPEPKVEPQPEPVVPKPKPELKVEPQPEPVVPKPKPESKVEPQPEPVVPKPKPELKVEPQPEPVVPKPKPEPKVEPQPEPVVPKPKPEPKVEPQPEPVVPKPKPEPKVEPQPEPVVPKPKPEPKVEPQPEPVVPKPKPEPKVEPQPEPVVPKPKPELKVEPQPQPVVPKPKPELKPETEAKKEPTSESAPKTSSSFDVLTALSDTLISLNSDSSRAEKDPAPLSNTEPLTDDLLGFNDSLEESEVPVPPSPGRWSQDLFSELHSGSNPMGIICEFQAKTNVAVDPERSSIREAEEKQTDETAEETQSSADPFDPYPIGTTSHSSLSDLLRPDISISRSSPSSMVTKSLNTEKNNALGSLADDIIPIKTDTSSSQQPGNTSPPQQTNTEEESRQEAGAEEEEEEEQAVETVIMFERKSNENDSPWDKWTSPTVYEVYDSEDEEEEERSVTSSAAVVKEEKRVVMPEPKKGLVLVKEYVNVSEMQNSRDQTNGDSDYLTSSSATYSYSSPSNYSRVPQSSACTYCGEQVGNDAKISIDHLNIHCHSSCFKCGECSKPMGDLLLNMFIHAGKVHCDSCYANVI
uniref:Zinc finger protein 185 with LIM domain n=1 Tax=Oryzias latipes TaxID=8090 RepID=A0A3P9KIG8_ORYLA